MASKFANVAALAVAMLGGAAKSASTSKYLTGEKAVAKMLEVLTEINTAKQRITYGALAARVGCFSRGMGALIDKLPRELQVLVVNSQGVPADGFWTKLEASCKAKGLDFEEQVNKVGAILKDRALITDKAVKAEAANDLAGF